MEPVVDLQRIESESFVRCIEYRTSTASTNDLALELARDDTRPLPLLVLAGRQTRGRGRGGNRWWSAEGALTFSLVIEMPGMATAPGDAPPVSLVAGLALCEAIDRLQPGEPICLKWPNDVLAGRRKLAGILTEVPARPLNRMVIGIGINVNNSLADAPEPLRHQAASLIDLAGRPFPLTDVLLAVLRQMDRRLADCSAGVLSLEQACAKWCALRGRHIAVETEHTRVSGICQGIDDRGNLVIDNRGTRHRCATGVVASIDWQQ